MVVCADDVQRTATLGTRDILHGSLDAWISYMPVSSTIRATVSARFDEGTCVT